LSLCLSGSWVTLEKSIFGRIFSLSIAEAESCICGLGGITPPNPIARMIFIFLAIAGLGATDVGALKIPILFNNLERCASGGRTTVFVLTVLILRLLNDGAVSVAMMLKSIYSLVCFLDLFVL